MFDEIIFYNHFGHGDLHESREFVRDIVTIIPAKAYKYAHGKSPKLLADLEGISFAEVDHRMHPKDGFKVHNNVLLINTWIGRDSKYVLPGIGCTIEEYYRMFNDILHSLGNVKLSSPPIEYIPTIDYRPFFTKNVDTYVCNSANQNVLICNGNVQSNQALNFDFTPTILKIAKEFKRVNFITTEKVQTDIKNIYYTGDIIKSPDSCDLNEISYLSVFCPMIIGRSSGPFLFSQTKINWMNPEKTFIGFTYTKEGSNIVNNLPVRAKKIWSNKVTADDVYKELRGAIEACQIVS